MATNYYDRVIALAHRFKLNDATASHARAFDTARDELGGEGGIRTPGTFQFNGFQDRRIRPLCHLSVNPTQNPVLKVGKTDAGYPKVTFPKKSIG